MKVKLKIIKDRIIGWSIIIGIGLFCLFLISLIIFGILNEIGFRFVFYL